MIDTNNVNFCAYVGIILLTVRSSPKASGSCRTQSAEAGGNVNAQPSPAEITESAPVLVLQ